MSHNLTLLIEYTLQSDDICDIDPSKMLLANVDRQFLGNYSCEAENAAGWGERSEEKELQVYYEPGNATLKWYPQIPIKKKSVTFECEATTPGNPKETRYHWLRNDMTVTNVATSTWIVEKVGLDYRTNISCYASNDGGDGEPATQELEVYAPPAFIKSLPQFSGAIYSTPNMSLTCRVECVPQCTIYWLKNGTGIEDETDDRYYIEESLIAADPKSGDFESVLSILVRIIYK